MEANNKIIKTELNGKTIEGKTNKEFVFNCLSEIHDMYKDLPVKQRIEEYVNYFVKTFSYDQQLANNTLNENKEKTRELIEDELTNLFINKKGVCNQFAQSLALLSCLDKDFDIHYCYCKVLTKKYKKEVGHVNNLVILNGEASIVDISSMIHAKEGEYKQDKSEFAFVKLEEYIEALKYENVTFTQRTADLRQYVLGSVRYLKEFDNNYIVLTTPAKIINDYGLNNDVWAVPTRSVGNLNI